MIMHFTVVLCLLLLMCPERWLFFMDFDPSGKCSLTYALDFAMVGGANEMQAVLFFALR